MPSQNALFRAIQPLPEILRHIESHVCPTYFDIFISELFISDLFISELMIECMASDILQTVAP